MITLFTMKSLQLFIFGCILLILISLEPSRTDDGWKEHEQTSARIRFRLPKLFDFQRFKNLYRKSYANLSEELRRTKLFLARAWRVYLSAVSYKNNLSSKYLNINDMSDWTLEERDAVYIHHPVKSDEERGKSVLQVADLDEVKHKLVEIIDHKGDNPTYARIAADLEDGSRVKRDLDDRASRKRRMFEIEELLRDPDELQTKKRLRQPVDEVQQVDPIPAKEGEEIDNQPVGGFLNGVLNFFSGFPNKPRDPNWPKDEVYLDYRDSGCISPIKQQSKCGACYIFAPIAVYEYHYCRQFGKIVEFSEQFIIDCGYRMFNLNGCAGGNELVSSFFIKKYGLELASYYPYRAANDTCPYDSSVSMESMGHLKVIKGETSFIRKDFGIFNSVIAGELERYGPMTISIFINDEFPDYGGGVDMLKNCTKKSSHAMTLIGHGIEDGLEYWLIRNSHGYSWGEQGYYKIWKDLDRKCLLNLGVIEAELGKNEKHNYEEVREKLLSRATIFEKILNYYYPG